MPVIALLTDFGTRDGYVASMKAVIKTICSQVSLIDVSHDIAGQQVDEAKFILWTTYSFFPDKTIFVCVVDPGVGTERRILAVKTERHIFLAPDNGLLDMVLSEANILEAYEVTNTKYFLPAISSTFHGRDIFSPLAAHLTNGIPLKSVGKLVALGRPAGFLVSVMDKGTYDGSIIYIDRFGNIVTNFSIEATRDATIVFQNHEMAVKGTYADATEGEVLALIGSSGLIEIAVRNGSAQKMFDAVYGLEVKLRAK